MNSERQRALLAIAWNAAFADGAMDNREHEDIRPHSSESSDDP